MPRAPERLQVLILTPDYPPAPGGIQLLMARLAACLEADVSVGTVGKGACDGSPTPLFRVGGKWRLPHRLEMALLNMRGVGAAASLRPDVVVAGHVVAMPAAALASRLFDVPSVLYVHADEFRTRAALSGWSVRRADAVIAVSDHAQRLATDAGAPTGRVTVISPGVDLPNSTSAIQRGADDRPTILTVARMVAAYKGHDRVLAALPLVRDSIPDVRWVVIGDGPRKGVIAAAASAAGLDSSVTMLGAVDNATREHWLTLADVFAMPSRLPPGGVGGEGFGIVYLEAAAYGVPVVAGDVGGAPDAVLHGETGLLVDPDDEGAIASALVELLSDPIRARSMGEAGVRHARRMSWTRHADQALAVLDRVVAERRPVRR